MSSDRNAGLTLGEESKFNREISEGLYPSTTPLEREILLGLLIQQYT